MSEVIGRGVIEISGDSAGLNATINDARKSIQNLGKVSESSAARSSASIDRYIRGLQTAGQTAGMSARETELYKLALRGASDAQLQAANSALHLTESYQRGIEIGDRIKASFFAIGAAAATGLIAATVAFDQLVKKAGDFQDLAEKTGDTAENIASLAVSAAVGGVAMEAVAGASEKLTKNLTGVDDESKDAGAAIAALGLNLKEFKNLNPADQIETIGKALNGFEDGAKKTAVAMALFGKAGAELLPFLKELGAEGGRQNILTAEQISLADDYADKQAKLSAEISLHAQAIATNMIPALNDFKQTIADLAKDQQFAATASDVLKGALSAGIVVFQTIAVVGSDVAFVFKGVGREIGAVAAQLAALASLDLNGFRAISDAVKADGEKARAELDRFQAKIMGIGQPKAAGSKENEEPDTARPKLKFNGSIGAGKNTAAAEAKAQLALDLEKIKVISESTINTFSNAEKIMEAKRAAGLLDEKEYYDAKLGFLRLNSAEQEKELEKEIARMQQEKLSGKDKIDNDKKILETQAKLAKVRENAAANIEVLSTQEGAALNKLAQYYRDAEAAANDYLDTLRKANARELSGFGIGNAERSRIDGRAQIEDKYSSQRQQLDKSRNDAEFAGTFGAEAQKKYDDEIDRIKRFQATALTEYDVYYAKRKEKEANSGIGAAEAMQNYFDAAQNAAKQMEDVFTHAFQSMEDAFVKFVMTGKLDFRSLAESIIADLVRIQARQLIASAIGGSSGGTNWLGLIGSIAGMAGGLSSGASTAGPSADAGGGNWLGDTSKLKLGGGRAIGGPVSAGQMYEVNEKGTPELLNVAGKQYLMMGSNSGTVDSNNSGNSGGGGNTIIVNVNSKTGDPAEIRRSAAAGARSAMSIMGGAKRYA